MSYLSPRTPQSADPNAPLLSVRKLQRVLGADNVIWDDINFDLSPGEVLFIRGPSGVGKTLLLRAIAQLDPYEVCAAFLDGKSPPLGPT